MAISRNVKVRTLMTNNVVCMYCTWVHTCVLQYSNSRQLKYLQQMSRFIQVGRSTTIIIMIRTPVREHSILHSPNVDYADATDNDFSCNILVNKVFSLVTCFLLPAVYKLSSTLSSWLFPNAKLIIEHIIINPDSWTLLISSSIIAIIPLQ